MLEDKIFNNSYDNVEYGTERIGQGSIAISPLVYDRYEESISEDISAVYNRKKIYEQLANFYDNSEYYLKYGKDTKKIEKGDISDIYYTFKSMLLNTDDHYNLVEVFCAIAEFFELNYKNLYNDVISLEDKAIILEILQESYGLERQFIKSKKLF